MRIHKDLAAGRWFTFSLIEQLANVGCDVDRIIQWRNRGETEYAQSAFDRAFELLELTIADPKNRGGTLKELLRVREFLIDYFVYNNEYGFDDQFWHDYFYEFNYMYAIARGR